MSQDPNLIDISQRLRRLMSAYDNASHAIGGSFVSVDPALEVEAARLRPEVERCAVLCHDFLRRLEMNPIFVAQRGEKVDDA